MSENRVRRVAGQIKKDLGQIINSEIKDPRLASVTSITDVELSRDLRYASVYVSIYGSEEEKEESFQTLLRASGFIRTQIGRRIRLRYTPELKFYLDSSMEYGAYIDRVLKSLKKDGNNDDGSTEDS